MRRKAREICFLLCLEKTWEWGCFLEYSIWGKELGSILLRHRITKYLDLASTRFRIHSVLKNFRSGEQILYAGFTGYLRTEAAMNGLLKCTSLFCGFIFQEFVWNVTHAVPPRQSLKENLSLLSNASKIKRNLRVKLRMTGASKHMKRKKIKMASLSNMNLEAVPIN